jgi:hypothetical protein
MGTQLKPTDFAKVMQLSTAARADLLEFLGSTSVEPSEISILIEKIEARYATSQKRNN